MKELVGGIALVVVSFFLLLVVSQLHPMGFPPHNEMDEYFIKNAQPELGANNVVTAVVFDYRGFDTLGEATVLFAAITSVFMLFWGRVK